MGNNVALLKVIVNEDIEICYGNNGIIPNEDMNKIIEDLEATDDENNIGFYIKEDEKGIRCYPITSKNHFCQDG